MIAIKSLQDLKQIRVTASEEQEAKKAAGDIQIIVGMGTCGIAAGADKTMNAIQKQIKNKGWSAISVTKTGCIGLCEAEPIVQIITAKGQKISYGNVTPELSRRILEEYVEGGKIIQESVINV